MNKLKKGAIEAAFNAFLNTLPVPDKKRRRASFFAPVQRFWVRNPAGGISRWLSVSRYSEEGDERQYNLRLASNDPRPLGIEIGKNSKGHDDAFRAFYCRNQDRLPLNTWVEIEYAPNPAPKPPLLLTWPDMKGAA